jgi:hypothetical protein
MAHSDAGRYAAKHKPGVTPDERIAGEIRKKTAAGKLGCVEAEGIGSKLEVSLAEIGRTLDLLELRIDRCQLGLFGYPAGKNLHPAAEVAPDLEASIRGCLTDGRLPCKAAWEIAARRKLGRMAVSSACEALHIRIKPCQLGAF